MCVCQLVPLEEGGEEKPVTDENKTHYLDLLAQYRLAKQTKTQVEHFVKGELKEQPHTHTHTHVGNRE